MLARFLVRPRWLLAVLAAAVAGAVLARRWLEIVVVEGESMAPTFVDGDRLLMSRPWRAIRRGDVVSFIRTVGIDGGQPLWIKRVHGLPGDVVLTAHGQREPVPAEHVHVRGDGTTSSDSRHFGPVHKRDLRGMLLARLT
jgi:signal peptidase I